MLIPLGTERPLRRPTVVTIALIAINVAIFLASILLERFYPILWNDRLLPNLWVHQRDFKFWTLLTSTFLHGGWLHVIGNMVFLWVFGQNVEDRFGRLWFLAFYLTGGIAASALHATFEKNPAIGASGAIAAVTGAFLVMFPRTHIKCLVWFLIIGVYSIPAWCFIVFAIARDFVFAGAWSDGVAHLAHLGGYIFGISISLFLLWTRILPRETYDLFSMGRQAYRRRQFREAGVRRDESMSRRHDSGGVEEETSDELSQARAEVGRLLLASDFAGATHAYKQLVERFAHNSTATTLSRSQQTDIANHLYAASDHQAAAYAYERFLEAYPRDSEAPRVRLMLGLINTRYLNDPIRARATLADLPRLLNDAQQRRLAETLIEELG